MKKNIRIFGLCLLILAVFACTSVGGVVSYTEIQASEQMHTLEELSHSGDSSVKSNEEPWEIILIETLDYIHIEKPVYGFINAYGSNTVPVMIKGSVIAYLFDELNINRNTIVPLKPMKAHYAGLIANDKQLLLEIEKERIVRTGMIKPELKYIIYHDTGNNNAGADALMHTRYIRGSGNSRARSWHYTVDALGIWQTIPDNEVAWHGDSYESYAYSIGIETCINSDNDLFLTWQLTAKLIAYLLDAYGLTPDAVMQHYEIMELAGMTGKDCPMTLRRAGLWETAKQLIISEYIYLQNIVKNGYKTEFLTESPEYIDPKGRIIALPNIETEVTYSVKITGPDNSVLEKRYTSVLLPVGIM